MIIDNVKVYTEEKTFVKGGIMLDGDKELYKAFNISAIPHVLVINDKKVVWTHSGYMPGNEVLVVDKALETIGKKWYSRENKTVLMAEKYTGLLIKL